MEVALLVSCQMVSPHGAVVGFPIQHCIGGMSCIYTCLSPWVVEPSIFHVFASCFQEGEIYVQPSNDKDDMRKFGICPYQFITPAIQWLVSCYDCVLLADLVSDIHKAIDHSCKSIVVICLCLENWNNPCWCYRRINGTCGFVEGAPRRNIPIISVTLCIRDTIQAITLARALCFSS